MTMILQWILLSSATGQVGTGQDKITLREYYDLLSKYPDSAARMQFLRRIVDQYPKFDRAYMALYEGLIAGDSGAGVKSVFAAGTGKDPALSQWMLARVYDREDSVSQATQAFHKALEINRDRNPRMLSEFIDFAFERKILEASLSWIHTLEMRASDQAVLALLADFRRDRYQQALKAAAELDSRLKDDPVLVDVRGYSQYKLRDLEQAKTTFRKGVMTAQRQGDKYYEAFFLMRVAMVMFAQKNHDEADSTYGAALAIARQIQSLDLTSKIAGNRGGFCFSRGEFGRALIFYDDALRAAEQIGEHNEMAAWYFGQALTRRSTQEYEGALYALDRALVHGTRSVTPNLLIQAHLEKGNLFTGLGLNRYAVREYEEAYTLAKSVHRVDGHRRAFGGIASILIAEGRFQRAREILWDLINVNPGTSRSVDLVYWRFKIADSFLREKKLRVARKAFEEVLDFAQKTRSSDYITYVQASAMLNIAKIQIETLNLDEARATLNIELLASQAAQREDVDLERNHLLGNLAAKSNQFAQARHLYERALEQFENQRSDISVDQFRIGFFGKGAELVNAMIELLAEQFENKKEPADLEALLVYLERNSARVLKERRQRAAASLTALPGFADYDRARSKLQRMQKTLRKNAGVRDSVIETYEALRFDLLSKRLKITDIAKTNTTSSPIEPEVMQTYLEQAHLNLVYYHLTDNLAFALTADGSTLQLTRLQTHAAEIALMVDSLMAPLQTLDATGIAKTPFRAEIAHALYDRLFRPLEDKLDAGRRVLIVPHATIMGLPFEMLLTARAPRSIYYPSDSSDYAQDLLLNHYTLSYSPALAVSMERKTSRRKDPRILVLANPLDDSGTVSDGDQRKSPVWPSRPLWFSDAEADGIQGTYARTRIFKRLKATKKAFTREAQDYDIIHMATHAFVDTAFDAFSGLVLAMSPDTLDDGLLMGHEIADLTLNNDLVTLSACETGRGRTVVGEGLLGLPRVFLSAGANSVIMALWKVDDKFSSLLMPRFYDYLLNQNLTKAESLRRAKLDMMRYASKEDGQPYQHPFYWSAFTLYGDPGMTAPETRGWDKQIVLVLLAFAVLVGYVMLNRRIRLRHPS